MVGRLEHVLGEVAGAIVHERVAGPCRRAGDHVGLGVVAHAEQVQLEQLAAEVLVGRLLAVPVVVEVHQHRRLQRHALGERPVVAQCVGAVVRQLLVERVRPVHVVGLGREVPVPEQGHLLDDGRRRGGHAVVPRGAQTGEPLRRLVDGQVERRRPGVGGVGRRVEDLVDDRRELLTDEGGDLGGVGVESRPAQQVGDVDVGHGHGAALPRHPLNTRPPATLSVRKCVAEVAEAPANTPCANQALGKRSVTCGGCQHARRAQPVTARPAEPVTA